MSNLYRKLRRFCREVWNLSELEASSNARDHLKRSRHLRRIFKTEDSCKPQRAFALLVNSIAEECNESVRFINRLDDQISDVTLRLQRKEKIVFPWDSLPHKNIWKLPSASNAFKLPLLGRFDKPSMQPVDDMVESQHTQWIREHPFAGKRLIASRFAQSDDALLSGALRKMFCRNH